MKILARYVCVANSPGFGKTLCLTSSPHFVSLLL
jgi:hypothetical protein